MSFTKKYSDEDVEEFDKWCEYMEEHEDDPDALTWKQWKERSKALNYRNWPEVPRKFQDDIIKCDPKSLFEIRNPLVTSEPGYKSSRHEEEIAFAGSFVERLYIQVELQRERDEEKIEWPDFRVNGKYWELKTLQTNNPKRVGDATRKAIHQVESAVKINGSLGGIMLDITNCLISLPEIIGFSLDRIVRSGRHSIKLIIIRNGRIISAYEKK